MGRSWMIGLTCVAGIFFLGGCSGALGEGGPCEGDACAGTTEAQEEATVPDRWVERTTEGGATVFFPTIPALAGVPDSIAPGVLGLSEKGCLLIEPLPKLKKKFPRALAHYP